MRLLIRLVQVVASMTITILIVGYFGGWYVSRSPMPGVDYFNSVANVALLDRNFSWWMNGFKDAVYTGYPLALDFPQFQYYGMLVLTKFLGVAHGVQYYVVFTLGLLAFWSFMLFWRISRSWGLGLILTIATFLSSNLYGSAIWGGSLPYFATQFSLPLVLFCLASFFESLNKKWMALAIIFSSVSFLAHPLPVASFVFPSALIMLFAYPIASEKWNLVRRLKIILTFCLGVYFGAFILLFGFTKEMVRQFIYKVEHPAVETVVQKEVSETDRNIANFYKSQVNNIYKGSDRLLVVGALASVGVLALGLAVNRKLRFLQLYSVMALITAYVLGHIVVNMFGFSFLPQGLYRAFWGVPIIFGVLICAGVRPIYEKISQQRIVGWTVGLVIGVVAIGGGYVYFNTRIEKSLEQVEKGSEASSAFPEILSINPKTVESSDVNFLASYMKPLGRQYRLYESDATVNIWWAGKYEIPLIRGYVDPPIGNDRRSSFFLLDTTLTNDTAVREFGYSEQMATNFARYLVDWYGVGYVEGGHVTPATSVPPSSYLIANGTVGNKESVVVPGAIVRVQTSNGKPAEARMDLTQSLEYYKVNQEYTSPILYGSNASVVLVVANSVGYEEIWKLFAGLGMDSKKVVLVNGGETISAIGDSELTKFDLVIMHRYRYKNKNAEWNKIQKYVAEGGKLFVDTGSEVEDTRSSMLPEWMPVKKLDRAGLGEIWIGEGYSDFASVDFSLLGRPVYDKQPWSFSFTDPNGVEGEILLKQSGKVVMAKRRLDKGEVLWSGINMPFYLSQTINDEAAKLAKYSLSELVDFDSRKSRVVEPVFTVNVPGHIRGKFNEEVRGVLYKVQGYEGWGTNLGKIWLAGPTYPGFMYMFAGDKKDFTFSYNGMPVQWFVTLISGLGLLVIVDIGMGYGVSYNVIKKLATKAGKKFWDKEEQ